MNANSTSKSSALVQLWQAVFVAFAILGAAVLSLWLFQPISVFMLVLGAVGVVAAVLTWLEAAGVSHREKIRQIRLRRRAEVEQKARVDFEAQLHKRDFQSRLRSFTNSDPHDDRSEPESAMEFWQRDDSYSGTPSRPFELLRRLLERISRLVSR